MSVKFDVFRGTQDGKIVSDTVSRTLKNHEVFIKTTHSGLCGTDEHYAKAGLVLGHEGVGIVQQVGSGVKQVKVGDRVGFGYTHKICGICDNCTTNWDQYCREREIYGFADTDNGSFSSGAVWDEKCVYPIPEGYDSAYAAPMMCAGATVWNVLSQYNARPFERVGIMGIGGLGHLAIKLAAAMGSHVVVLSSSESKRKEAMEYGASEFHVWRSGDKAPAGFQPLKHLLLCGSAGVDYQSLLELMDTNSSVYPLTVALEPTPVLLLALNMKGIKIQGSLVGSRDNIIKLLEFANKKKIYPTIMRYPLTEEGIVTAMQELRDGQVRYRAVLVRDE